MGYERSLTLLVKECFAPSDPVFRDQKHLSGFQLSPIRSNQHTIRCEGKRRDVLRRQTLPQLLPAVLSII